MKKRSRPITKDDVKFVYENYAKMASSEIAEKLGISRFQVMKIVSELRKRGVDIPKKIGRKENPIDAFVKELEAKGVQLKPKKAAKK
ncbi:MarR family transcriptional regulator [Thermosulfuriphilus ammonigenes]|uniref:MarR family transcriptional regulator n=1 Tax=Thermosulfuriphilus ammonigenes TaxID=1936021 RepID=A0A6G7PWD1_9BACT|nr:MarR family transcriptional regulator [Thermosulfuriphilus ammonigenes]MBA2847908.1 transposase [Thermosulfuriphilus ammonigenes]QIJ71897.1 MarR family transcriptional regulator [Thermosulfuriphilus ammonigenes]